MATRDYNDEFVTKALELAAVIGMRPAARSLQIPVSTLHTWTTSESYAARWAELRRDNAPAWRARAAATMEELVDEYSQLEADVLEKARKTYDELEPRDVGNMLRSVAVAKGVTADHVGKLRGQPTVIVERRFDAAQLEQAMQALLESAPAIDVESEEITPAELVEGDE